MTYNSNVQSVGLISVTNASWSLRAYNGIVIIHAALETKNKPSILRSSKKDQADKLIVVVLKLFLHLHH